MEGGMGGCGRGKGARGERVRREGGGLRGWLGTFLRCCKADDVVESLGGSSSFNCADIEIRK